jgi:hypothetical protein
MKAKNDIEPSFPRRGLAEEDGALLLHACSASPKKGGIDGHYMDVGPRLCFGPGYRMLEPIGPGCSA